MRTRGSGRQEVLNSGKIRNYEQVAPPPHSHVPRALQNSAAGRQTGRQAGRQAGRLTFNSEGACINRACHRHWQGGWLHGQQRRAHTTVRVAKQRGRNGT
ncbi:hypothetical protein EON67_02315 [archaeon]|nr:MAG: hypothetical protein EON67_02315 [archaeon]